MIRPGRRPRVLYLAFYFPPTRASGVFRSRATANFLAERGWDVTVHTAPREFFTDYIDSCDPTLEEGIDPRVEVVRPGMSFAHWEKDIRKFSWFRGSFPTLATMVRRKVTDAVFPEHYSSWISRVVTRALTEHARRRYDVVVATGNPFASFAAAWILHRLLRVPYVLDYRDSWTFNQFTEEVKYPPGHQAWRWEARVLAEASEIVFVNGGMRGWYADRYPAAADRMTVVPNGWEPEILGDVSAEPVGDRPLRFGYVGTVTDAMPMDELFEGWRLARKDPAMSDASLHIYGHLGFFPQHVASLRPRIERHRDAGVHYEGAVGKADIAGVYDGLDVLLFWVPGARYVTSGKVFEYMATGKPMVSVHRPDIAAVDVLSGHPQWVPNRTLEPEDVAEALVEGARRALTTTPEVVRRSKEHALAFTREAVLTPWEQRLRVIAGG